jgi:hypothetical protein
VTLARSAGAWYPSLDGVLTLDVPRQVPRGSSAPGQQGAAHRRHPDDRGVGHAFEGKAPSFFSDPKFLLIGPLWFLKKITGRGGADAAATDVTVN